MTPPAYDHAELVDCMRDLCDAILISGSQSAAHLAYGLGKAVGGLETIACAGTTPASAIRALIDLYDQLSTYRPPARPPAPADPAGPAPRLTGAGTDMSAGGTDPSRRRAWRSVLVGAATLLAGAGGFVLAYVATLYAREGWLPW